MAKREAETQERAAARKVPARTPLRRTAEPASATPAPAAPAAGKPPRSALRRLAAEVERLQAELAAARVRMKELEAHAEVDPLTDVLNRRGFERELARALAYIKRYGTRAALIYLDLDGFKPINDRFGHAAGDAVLKAVARALTRAVRASDVVARLGGDEFVLLLWNLTDEDAVAKALAVEAVVAGATVRWRRATLAVGASAGAAPLGPLDQPVAVLARADKAMYARKTGRR